jgi:hypothetical protein
VHVIPLHLSDFMKTAFAILVALCVSTHWTNAQTTGQTTPTDTPYAVVARGAHQRVWQRTTYETTPSGQVRKLRKDIERLNPLEV